MRTAVRRMLSRNALLSVVAVTLLAPAFVPSDASAGEIIPRRRFGAGAQGMRLRTVRQSTFADKRLNKRIAPSRTESFKTTSPYDHRIYEQARAQTAYEQKYAKWEARVNKMEAKSAERSRKEQQKDRERFAKLQQRQQERIAKAQRDSERSKLRLGRNDKSVIVDTGSKRRDAEEYFGASSQESAPRPSLWQRLKRAIFGG